MIKRSLEEIIEKKMGSGKAIILVGPRQVGKTTLINHILENRKHLFLDGDDPTTRNILSRPNTEQLKQIIGDHKIVFVDEAQRIENIGITLKIITDRLKYVQLLVSGSSAFELNNETNETLTGRKWEYKLLPISWREFEDHVGYLRSEQNLELRMRFGMYPEVINNPGSEIELLRELVNSYLYKDILAFSNIRKPEIVEKLLRALALQIGNEVSYNELAQLLMIDKNTVSSYIDILIKGYVIFKLPSFSKNIRNEIKSNQKIYFVDTGIRNMIVGNFNAIDSRTDTGTLWENFLISERFKKLNYGQSRAQSFFWRTTNQQEIDYVEDISGHISGFEFKWNPKAKIKLYSTFIGTYQAEMAAVNKENFRNFIG